MEHLSIREQEGAQLIEKLTGRTAQILVDPTLVLDKDDWNPISKKVDNKPKRYILCYMMGSLTSEEQNYIQEISNKNNLEIIDINNPEDWAKYKCGPSEFIDLLKSAELICTNSFHGAIFSMVFSVPFVIFSRKNYTVNDDMSSRMSNLSKKFNLNSRFFENIEEKNIFKIYFKEIEKNMKIEREKVYLYLKKALATRK